MIKTFDKKNVIGIAFAHGYYPPYANLYAHAHVNWNKSSNTHYLDTEGR